MQKISYKELQEVQPKLQKPIYPKEFGVKVVGIEIIKVDDVSVETYLNQIRVSDNIKSRGESLSTSFNEVNWNEPLPVVKKTKNNSYELIDAFGRFSMFDDAGQEYWLMTIVEVEPEMEIDFKVYLNNKPTRVYNTIDRNFKNKKRRI